MNTNNNPPPRPHAPTQQMQMQAPPHFNLSALPQIPVVIPSTITTNILPSHSQPQQQQISPSRPMVQPMVQPINTNTTIRPHYITSNTQPPSVIPIQPAQPPIIAQPHPQIPHIPITHSHTHSVSHPLPPTAFSSNTSEPSVSSSSISTTVNTTNNHHIPYAMPPVIPQNTFTSNNTPNRTTNIATFSTNTSPSKMSNTFSPNSKPKQPPKPPTPTQLQRDANNKNQPSPSKSTSTSNNTTSTNSRRSRKRSISEMKEEEGEKSSNPNTNNSTKNGVNNINNNKTVKAGNTAKRRKLSRGASTNRVWRQTRQNAKFRMAIELLDTFRSDHGGKLPSLRAVMKMLKVGFPKAHEILNEYAKHIGCSKDKLVQDMTIRQEKKNKGEMDGNRKQRKMRNMFEYPVNVNGKLQEIMLSLLYHKKTGNLKGKYQSYAKLEKSLIEFDHFYEKFALNDKLRIGQSYFMLAEHYFYDHHDFNEAYDYIRKALKTFRDCNYLAIKAGFHVTTLDQSNSRDSQILINRNLVFREDIGYFWSQIFEIYILGGHILLDNRQYGEARHLYLFALELVKFIKDSPVINGCIALESLSQVAMLQNNLGEAVNWMDEIIKILQKDERDQATKTIDIDGNEENIDHKIKLLNIKAYYACILSLYNYENRRDFGEDFHFNSRKAMEIYEDVLRECKDKYGETHRVTVGMYLYFGLHFVNVENYETAFIHIEFIENLCEKHNRSLSFEEMQLFQDLLSAFIVKLLSVGNENRANLMLFNDNELKDKCLKIFKLQLFNTDAVNQEIIHRQQNREKRNRDLNNKEKEKKDDNNDNNEINDNTNNMQKKPKIKKENDEEDIINFKPKPKEELKVIDKNEIILSQHMTLLLHKFKDFARVQGMIENFEKNQVTLTDVQIHQFDAIKRDLKILQENMNRNHNIDLNEGNSKSNHGILSPNNHHHHNMRYDFNSLPDFLPTAPGSD